MIHPISLFVALQLVWVTITLLWVFWFVDEVKEIAALANSFGAQHFNPTYALIIMIVGCILLGVLLVGTVSLFFSRQRQAHLITQQKNFLSSVTHELRSPLASVKLNLETIVKRNLDPGMVRKVCEHSLTDVERLSRLVSQILISARLDRGIAQFEDDAETVRLAEILHKAVLRVHWLDATVEQRVQIDCPRELKLYSSPTILLLIFVNLLENAIKYSPRATQIVMAVEERDRSILVVVRDSGFGIAEGDLKKIFKMFHRSTDSLKKAIPGTGLGLFIVHSLVRLLKGKVWAESSGLNAGSQFFVSIPLIARKTAQKEDHA